MTVPLPAVLLVLDVWPLRRLGGGRAKWFGAAARNVWIEKVPFFAISIVGSALAFRAFRYGGLTPMEDVGGLQRIVMIFYGLAFYVWKTLAPMDLAPFYAITPHPLAPHSLPAQVGFPLVMVMAAGTIPVPRKLPG